MTDIDKRIEQLKADQERIAKQAREDKFIFRYPAYDQTKTMDINTETGRIHFKNTHIDREFDTDYVLLSVPVYDKLIALLESYESGMRSDEDGTVRRSTRKHSAGTVDKS